MSIDSSDNDYEHLIEIADNKAPREWVLFPTLKGGIVCNGPQINEPTMVIEKSDYDKLQLRLEKCEALLRRAELPLKCFHNFKNVDTLKQDINKFFAEVEGE